MTKLKIHFRDAEIESRAPEALRKAWKQAVSVANHETEGKTNGAGPGDKVIYITDGLDPCRVIELALSGNVKHVVQLSSPRMAKEVDTAAWMIQDLDGFLADPVTCILGKSDLPRFSFPFNTVDQKQDALSEMKILLGTIPKAATIREQVASVADELFTNAALHGHGSGKGPEGKAAGEGRNSELFLSHDGERLLVGCKDPFGTLDPSRIMAMIAKTFERGIAASINLGEGGANIGSRMVYEACASMYLAVEKGKCSVVCCTLPLGWRSKQQVVVAKSIHIAVKGEEE